MGRLIDADAFEKFIKEKYKDGESTDDIKDQMLFDLSYQPTAYEIEKVVAALKKESDYEPIDYDYCDVACTDEQYFIATDKAIDIVRKGGVE